MKSLYLLTHFISFSIALSIVLFIASFCDLDSFFIDATIKEIESQHNNYTLAHLDAIYKKLIDSDAFLICDSYLSYLSLNHLDDFLIVRFLVPLLYLKYAFIFFIIFCSNLLFFYKKVYERKHYQEQSMRVLRYNKKFIVFVFVVLCLEPFYVHALLSISLILFAIYLTLNKVVFITGLNS